MSEDIRKQIVAEVSGVTVEEVTESRYTHNGYECGSEEWRVLTDSEADEAAKEYIADTLWAFNPQFLAAVTGLPREVYEALADKCEDANEPVRKMVDATCGLDDLVEEALRADGRGHFLSQYDGEEIKKKIGEEVFYVYRVN